MTIAAVAWTDVAIGGLATLGLVLLALGLAGFAHHVSRRRALSHIEEEKR